MKDRTRPHSTEAEQALIGSMLLNPRDVIGECVERITPEYFYIPAHQTLYTLLVDLWRDGAAIDTITFTQTLRDRHLMQRIGGEGTVEGIQSFVPSAANYAYYLAIIHDKYILRQIIASATESAHKAYEEQGDVDTLLAEHERKALAIRPTEKTKILATKELVMESIERLEKVVECAGKLTGLATGFADLDRMTGGLRDSDMIVVAARPSMGKTSLAMNIAEHVAIDLRKAVGVFSLEMSAAQLMDRLLCSRARVNLQKVRDGYLHDRDYPSLTAAASKIAEAKLYIDDESGLQIEKLTARARRWKHEHNIALLVVDYLQLLETARPFKDRQPQVAYQSKALKNLARELHIPVIVLAQLNRDPEKRTHGRPRMSDLRESGAIEADADLIGLLVRPEVYAEDEEQKMELRGEAELIIAKQRNGPVGEIALTFLSEFTRFEDRARHID